MRIQHIMLITFNLCYIVSTDEPLESNTLDFHIVFFQMLEICVNTIEGHDFEKKNCLST